MKGSITYYRKLDSLTYVRNHEFYFQFHKYIFDCKPFITAMTLQQRLIYGRVLLNVR